MRKYDRHGRRGGEVLHRDVFVKRKEGICPLFFLWIIKDSNLGPTGYEPVALTAALMIRMCLTRILYNKSQKKSRAFLGNFKKSVRAFPEAHKFYKKGNKPLSNALVCDIMIR